MRLGLPSCVLLLVGCAGTTLPAEIAELRPVSTQPDDDDSDGITNLEDRCRFVAAYTQDGCPVTGTTRRDDADFDGIANKTDRCDDDSGIAPHGCPPKVPGATKIGDVSYVLDRVTADYPRKFVDVAPANGPTVAFADAHATQVIDGVYVARFGPFVTPEVAAVEYKRLVDALSAVKPSCCALHPSEVREVTRWSVVESEPAFRALVMEARVERVAQHHEVVLRIGTF